MPSNAIMSKDARFQQFEALLHNRNRRLRERRMLVQGVRPLTIAISNGWTLEIALYAHGSRLSDWASRVVRAAQSSLPVRSELLAELGEKADGNVEVVCVVATPEDSLSRIEIDARFSGLLFDRPTQPGNIGTLLRSADALSGSGLVISGHAADLYDPKSVRASTGSLFALPSVRVPSPDPVLDWLDQARAREVPVQLVATDEDGDCDVWDFDFTQPVLVLIGNETSGLSRAWREVANASVRIPMAGSASSLNAATAASLVLYEVKRQRTAAVANQPSRR